jgi:hypothetical protein
MFIHDVKREGEEGCLYLFRDQRHGFSAKQSRFIKSDRFGWYGILACIGVGEVPTHGALLNIEGKYAFYTSTPDGSCLTR